MSEEDAKQLVRDAIRYISPFIPRSLEEQPFCRAGIFNDMGSGSYVDLVVIKPKDDVQYLRTFDEANVKVYKTKKYEYFLLIVLLKGRASREVHIPQGGNCGPH